MSAQDNEAALPGGVDLDAWARSGAQLAPPGAVASRVLYTPQLDTARAACSSDGAAAGGGGNASAAGAAVHEIFSSDFANCWGGPSDYFLFGRTSAMALMMRKARVFDALIVDRGVRCHPETLTRCALQELARERTLRGAGGGAVHLVAHTALKLGFCRRWAQQTVCTGRRDCVSVDGAAAFWGPAGAAPAACEPIIFTPL
jgi:hypothetical protein